jgi:hypothetical protein
MSAGRLAIPPHPVPALMAWPANLLQKYILEIFETRSV